LECSKPLYLEAAPDKFRATACQYCGAPVPPPLVDGDTAYVSYEALRAGDAILTKDTEYGMISWEQLIEGWTNGRPGATFPGFETRITEGGWTQIKLPIEVMLELVTTPDFSTWQGSEWLFVAGMPMTYVGEWQREDFERQAPDGVSPAEFFRDTLRDRDIRLWDCIDNLSIYAFRDPVTGRYAAYYDMD
jgi:hypothetical protein